MGKVVVVAGTPGVGKTTLLRLAKPKLKKWEIVNYGDILEKMGREEGLIKDRDELRHLPLDQQRRLQRLAAHEIAIMAERKNILLDTHMTIKTPEGFWPGLPKWVLKEIRPYAFILIEAPPEEILERRNKDKTRKRMDQGGIEEIREHQEINRAFAVAYSVLTSGSIIIIQNRTNRLEEAVERFVKVLEEELKI